MRKPIPSRHHLWQRWTSLADDNMAALSDECSRQQTTVSDGSICEIVERADGFPTPRAHPEALVNGGLQHPLLRCEHEHYPTSSLGGQMSQRKRAYLAFRLRCTPITHESRQPRLGVTRRQSAIRSNSKTILVHTTRGGCVRSHTFQERGPRRNKYKSFLLPSFFASSVQRSLCFARSRPTAA